jgi:hypothetical protein
VTAGRGLVPDAVAGLFPQLRHRRPGAVHLTLQTDRVGSVLRIRKNITGDIVTGLHGMYLGHREFLHRSSLIIGARVKPQNQPKV